MERDNFKAWAAIIAVVAVLLNVAFFFLSDSYYADKTASQLALGKGADAFAADLQSARVAFVVFSLVVSAALVVIPLAARQVAFGLTGLVATGLIVGGIAAAKASFNALLPVALSIVGFVMAALIFNAAAKKSRGAWAFLTAICAVLAICTLFGATKIRNAVHVGLWYALIVSGLCAVATTALVAIRRDYDE